MTFLLDFTDKHLFDEESANKNRMLKRVIKSSQFNDKVVEIKEHLEEIERQKNQKYEDTLGDVNDYEQVTQKSSDERRQEIEATRKSEYAKVAESIQRSLGISPGGSSGGFGFDSGSSFNSQGGRNQTASNPLINWMTYGRQAKTLTSLEFENNRKIVEKKDEKKKSSFSMFGGGQDVVKEPRKNQKFRMKSEDWRSYLYAYRLSLFTTVMSIPGLIINKGILFSNPLITTFIAAGIAAFTGYKLTMFEDGPLAGNYLGSDKNVDAAEKEFEANKDKPEEKKKNSFASRFGGGSQQNSSDFSAPGEFVNYNDDDDDDISYEDEYEDENDNGIDDDAEKEAEFGSVLLPTPLNSSDKERLYEGEAQFLRWVAEHRSVLSTVNNPGDILQIMSPIIVSFNSKFAKTGVVERNSDTFKNIAYFIGKIYSQIDKRFGSYSKWDEKYYYSVDSIVETVMYYKIKVKLPQSIDPKSMVQGMSTFKAFLKAFEDDKTDANITLTGDEGYIKIFKINDAGFMPLVSTGDVLRFNGMKTKKNKPLLEDLSSPADLKVLLGLSNAENALTFDFGGDQNSNLMIAGATGSGKSISTGAWFMNVISSHTPDEVGFIIFDPKDGTFWKNFATTPHVLGMFGQEDLPKLPALINLLRTSDGMRQKYINNEVHMQNYYEARSLFAKREDWERMKKVPRLIIILDEQKDTLSALDTIDNERKAFNNKVKKDEKKFATFQDAYNTSLGAIANVTREAGITMAALSQRTEAKSLPRTFLAGSSMKFVMKMPFEGDVTRAFGKDAVLPSFADLPTGSGYFLANGLKLSQVSTPVFSGNPKMAENLASIVGLAWTIIQDYKTNLSKEPKGYFLSEAVEKNAEVFNTYDIDEFSPFNRDKQFKHAKEILMNGDILFDPDIRSDLRIDLDKLKQAEQGQGSYEEAIQNANYDAEMKRTLNNVWKYLTMKGYVDGDTKEVQSKVIERPSHNEDPKEEPKANENTVAEDDFITDEDFENDKDDNWDDDDWQTDDVLDDMYQPTESDKEADNPEERSGAQNHEPVDNYKDDDIDETSVERPRGLQHEARSSALRGTGIKRRNRDLSVKPTDSGSADSSRQSTLTDSNPFRKPKLDSPAEDEQVEEPNQNQPDPNAYDSVLSKLRNDERKMKAEASNEFGEIKQKFERPERRNTDNEPDRDARSSQPNSGGLGFDSLLSQLQGAVQNSGPVEEVQDEQPRQEPVVEVKPEPVVQESERPEPVQQEQRQPSESPLQVRHERRATLGRQTEETDNHVKGSTTKKTANGLYVPDKEKDDLTFNDVKLFFIENELDSVQMNYLKTLFSQSAIDAAIARDIISLQLVTNKVVFNG